jgi:hypothetical protein
MSDDKRNRGKPDRNLISFKERYEFDYAAKQLQKQVPGTTKPEAKEALTEFCKEDCATSRAGADHARGAETSQGLICRGPG